MIVCLANPEKCHLILSCDNEITVCVKNYTLQTVNVKNYYVLKIDHKLNFNIHIDEIC